MGTRGAAPGKWLGPGERDASTKDSRTGLPGETGTCSVLTKPLCPLFVCIRVVPSPSWGLLNKSRVLGCKPLPLPAPGRPSTRFASDPGTDNRADQIRCGAKQIRSDQMRGPQRGGRSDY
jgi:hypothetical protein